MAEVKIPLFETIGSPSLAVIVDPSAPDLKWYRLCGYDVHEVPRLPVTQRATHVLEVLAASGA